jgi:hypothetical protein
MVIGLTFIFGQPILFWPDQYRHDPGVINVLKGILRLPAQGIGQRGRLKEGGVPGRGPQKMRPALVNHCFAGFPPFARVLLTFIR